MLLREGREQEFRVEFSTRKESNDCLTLFSSRTCRKINVKVALDVAVEVNFDDFVTQGICRENT